MRALARLLLVAILFTALLPAPPAAAEVANVGCDVAELIAAFQNVAVDTINLDGECTYRLFAAMADGSGIVVERDIAVNGNGATITRLSEDQFRLFEVRADGDLALRDLTLTGGQSEEGREGATDGQSGGAVLNLGALNLERVTITDNRAGDGIAADGSGGNGGGIASAGVLTLTNVTISGNAAGSGTGAKRAGWGAGISAMNGTVTLTHVTIADNVYGLNGPDHVGALSVGQIYYHEGNVTSATMRNSIVRGPTPVCVLGGVPPNLVPVVSGTLASDSTCDATAVGEPALGALADNTGLTRTMGIGSGSPALDLGAANCLAADQRGVARPTPCDAGAFEYVAPPPPPDPDPDPDPEPPVITDVTPKRLPRGKTTRVAVTGLRFQTGATFTLTGTGITWTLVSLSPPTSAVLDISVADDGEPPRNGITVRITNPDGGTDEWCCLELYSPEPPEFTRTFDPEDPERIGTAIAVSKLSHPTGSETAALVASERYPDALAAGPLAALLDAPVLLTDSAGLPAAVADELTRLKVLTVILVGGYAALDERVADDLRTLGITVERLRGVDRFGTARAVAERIGGDEAYITVGGHADSNLGWPDAVATSGLASMRRVPIVLVHSDGIPSDSAAALSGRRTATIVGGEAAVSEDVKEALIAGGLDVGRLSGDNRYATSVATARSALLLGARANNVWLVTGHAFSDGLAAGGAVAKARGLLLFVDGTDPSGGKETMDLLRELAGQVRRLTIVGGPAAVTPAVETAVREAVGAG